MDSLQRSNNNLVLKIITATRWSCRATKALSSGYESIKEAMGKKDNQEEKATAQSEAEG